MYAAANTLGMSVFDQTLHPRHQAGNAQGGQFIPKHHSKPEQALEHDSMRQEPLDASQWTIDDLHAQESVLEHGKLHAIPTTPGRVEYVLANRSHDSRQWGISLPGTLPQDWDETKPWASSTARPTYGRLRAELTRQHNHLRRRLQPNYPAGLIPSPTPVAATTTAECELELRRIIAALPNTTGQDRDALTTRLDEYRDRYITLTTGSDDRRVKLIMQLLEGIDTPSTAAPDSAAELPRTPLA